MPHLIGYFPGGGGEKPLSKKAFSECTWAEVSKVCKAGLASEYWKIGDTKNMIEGDPTTGLRIIGFDHDPAAYAGDYGREKAGITLEMICPPLTAQHHTSFTAANVVWYSETSNLHSDIREIALPNYLANTIPEELRKVIIPVDKEFRLTGGGQAYVYDTLFLLSVNEMTGNMTSTFGSEGTQYAYYAAGNPIIHRDANGAAVDFWTRSGNGGTDGYFYQIKTNGTSYKMNPNKMFSVFPCMCI